MKFEFAEPTGTILSIEDLEGDEYREVRKGDVKYEDEDAGDDEWFDMVEDPEADISKLTTTDGVFYFIAQNMDGHGRLYVVREVK